MFRSWPEALSPAGFSTEWFLIPEWGETVFTEQNCDWSNDDYYVCYHVPTAGTNIFGS